MKFKVDENFGSRSVHLFDQAGHDAETVRQEGLGGATGHTIFETCVRGERWLLTLDLDFADVLRFPPDRTAGIAVLRLPKQPSLSLLEKLSGDLLRMLRVEPIAGRLWIVEPGRIRVHEDTAANPCSGAN
jgi:predicted nuclease of predicted toxin-antitoxin system